MSTTLDQSAHMRMALTDEHPTPSDIVERARRLMGGIDLDPATSPEFNLRVQAAHILTPLADGLLHSWDWDGLSQRVFLNPPGGRLRKDKSSGKWLPVKGGRAESSALVWWAKLCREWELGSVSQAVFVGFNLEIMRTSQKCRYPVQAFPRCYPKDRLAFAGEDPTHANVLVWLPPKGTQADPWQQIACRARMAEAFGEVGYCEGGSA
jgi:hypothetical protein